MSTHLKYSTMSALAHNAIRHVLNHPAPDAVLSIESHMFDVVLEATDAAEYDMDVGKNLWLNVGRWSRLMKEYVPKDGLNRFIGQALEILGGSARDGACANMMFRDPDRYAKKHRWGGCLMGATFRAGPRDLPPTLTFYSRTTYIGYMGFMDMAIAARIAQAINDQRDQAKGGYGEPIRFLWYLSSMQVHCFKSLPYIFSQPGLMNFLEDHAAKNLDNSKLPPTWKHIVTWYGKILRDYKLHGLKMLEVEKYGPFRRIKRRWCEHKRYLTKHIPPTLPVSKLTFEKCV